MITRTIHIHQQLSTNSCCKNKPVPNWEYGVVLNENFEKNIILMNRLPYFLLWAYQPASIMMMWKIPSFWFSCTLYTLILTTPSPLHQHRSIHVQDTPSPSGAEQQSLVIYMWLALLLKVFLKLNKIKIEQGGSLYTSLKETTFADILTRCNCLEDN